MGHKVYDMNHCETCGYVIAHNQDICEDCESRQRSAEPCMGNLIEAIVWEAKYQTYMQWQVAAARTRDTPWFNRKHYHEVFRRG
jgi:hypothetical protein